MLLYSPPFVNESSPLSVFSNEQPHTCFVSPNNKALAITLVDSPGNSSINGTFVFNIPHNQSEGEYSIFCQVSIGQSIATTLSKFSVIGKAIMYDHTYLML